MVAATATGEAGAAGEAGEAGAEGATGAKGAAGGDRSDGGEEERPAGMTEGEGERGPSRTEDATAPNIVMSPS